MIQFDEHIVQIGEEKNNYQVIHAVTKLHPIVGGHPFNLWFSGHVNSQLPKKVTKELPGCCSFHVFFFPS